jgi:CDP-glycerol glycerophosphotransferase
MPIDTAIKRDRTNYLRQWFFGMLSLGASFIIRQNPRKIVLTSFHGDGYRGNTRFIFEAMMQRGDFDAVWLSRNPSVVQALKSRFGDSHAALAHSFEGLKHLASASVAGITHGTSDFAFMLIPRRTKIVQTYHGLPTKRGEYMRPTHDRGPNWLHRIILKHRFDKISYFLSSSKCVSALFSKRFGVPPDRFVETGFPAYDELMSIEKNPKFLADLIEKNASKYASANAPKTDCNETNKSDISTPRLLLYAPTFRRIAETKWFPFDDLNITEIASFLDKNNIYCILRAHPNDSLNVAEYRNISARFLDGGQALVENVNQLIANSDLIITDYSSIYLEGLLRDIPCLFLPYDRDKYERGFPLPYDEVTPGPKPRTQSEFICAICDGMALEPQTNCASNGSNYVTERKRVRDIYFDAVDNQATDRAVDLFRRLVAE